MEATLQPISFFQFALSAPRERTFITSNRGVLLVSVALVVVLHLAVLLVWVLLPPSEPVQPREMEVTIAMAVPPEVQPETPPTPPPPKPVPPPRKVVSAPEPLPVQPKPLPVQEAQPSETPVEQPVVPVQVAAPVQVTAAPAPVAQPIVVPSPPQPPPVIEPEYKASYLNNAPPRYPLAARRMGVQGKVVLNVEVLAEGLCGQANVHQSSGHEMLDNAALRTVKNWKFIPARQGGQAITKWFKVPIQFTLKEDEA